MFRSDGIEWPHDDDYHLVEHHVLRDVELDVHVHVVEHDDVLLQHGRVDHDQHLRPDDDLDHAGARRNALHRAKAVGEAEEVWRQRLTLLVKDAAVAAAQPCEANGELVIASVGVGAPSARFALDAALWGPIKAKRPEKGCRYRKGPVALTVLLKAGKGLKVVADGADLWSGMRHTS